jgi:hypothetical protein
MGFGSSPGVGWTSGACTPLGTADGTKKTDGWVPTLQCACKLTDRHSRVNVSSLIAVTSLELRPTGLSTRAGRLQEFFDLEMTHVEA